MAGSQKTSPAATFFEKEKPPILNLAIMHAGKWHCVACQRPYICDTFELISRRRRQDIDVLLDGADEPRRPLTDAEIEDRMHLQIFRKNQRIRIDLEEIRRKVKNRVPLTRSEIKYLSSILKLRDAEVKQMKESYGHRESLIVKVSNRDAPSTSKGRTSEACNLDAPSTSKGRTSEACNLDAPSTSKGRTWEVCNWDAPSTSIGEQKEISSNCESRNFDEQGDDDDSEYQDLAYEIYDDDSGNEASSEGEEDDESTDDDDDDSKEKIPSDENDSTEKIPHEDDRKEEIPHEGDRKQEIHHEDDRKEEIHHEDDRKEEIHNEDDRKEEIPQDDNATEEIPHDDNTTGEIPHDDDSTEEVPYGDDSNEEAPFQEFYYEDYYGPSSPKRMKLDLDQSQESTSSELSENDLQRDDDDDDNDADDEFSEYEISLQLLYGEINIKDNPDRSASPTTVFEILIPRRPRIGQVKRHRIITESQLVFGGRHGAPVVIAEMVFEL